MLSVLANNIYKKKIKPTRYFILSKIKLIAKLNKKNCMKKKKTHLIVSRKVFRSVISSGIRLKILLREADFLLSS